MERKSTIKKSIPEVKGREPKLESKKENCSIKKTNNLTATTRSKPPSSATSTNTKRSQIDSRLERLERQREVSFNLSQVKKPGNTCRVKNNSTECAQLNKKSVSKIKEKLLDLDDTTLLIEEIEGEPVDTNKLMGHRVKNSVSEMTIELENLENCSDDKILQRLKSEPNLRKGYPEDSRGSNRLMVTTISRRVEIPDSIKAVMVDDANEEEFYKKMSLLKCRYQHIIKSELVDFVAPSDDGLLPENSKDPEFISTLMGLVEQDKEISNIAVNLVSQIDLMEKAEMGYKSKKSGATIDQETFQEIWENHKKCRKEMTFHLEQERKQLFKDKILKTEQVESLIKTEETLSPIEEQVTKELDKESLITFMEESLDKMKNSAPDKEDETPNENERDKEIRRGLDRILRRLGCESSISSKTESSENALLIIQDKMKSLKKDLERLRSLP